MAHNGKFTKDAESPCNQIDTEVAVPLPNLQTVTTTNSFQVMSLIDIQMLL